MQIGAQLFTVREHTKTLEDFAATLEKIAQIGYTTVQVSGTCEFEPEWLRDQLKRVGLTCCVTHRNPDKLTADTEAEVTAHNTFGCKYIGVGSMPGAADGVADAYEKFKANFRPVAQKIIQLGSKFMYHNHAFEFERTDNNETYLDCLISDFSKDELSFILDTYWIQTAGGNPVKWIDKLAGRLQCVHLKDISVSGNDARMAPVYAGNMDFDAIIEACGNAGTEYLLVEQDDCYGVDPFECLALSYKNLKTKGL